MKHSAIIIFLVNYCASLFGQNLTLSRTFETKRQNVVLSIINNHSNYFYVLRYNKLGHDMAIERRNKPSGEILSFTPLRLDSVNSKLFDYEKLDYLFFENNNKAYFLFEKYINSKKTLYLKVADTSGKSSGFIELASLNKIENVTNFYFEYKITNNKLLIVGTQSYSNNTQKKVVMLYDVEKLEKIWIKKMPIENSYTGYSTAHEINSSNELSYILIKARVVSFKREFVNQSQVTVPVLFYDTISLISLKENPSLIFHKSVLLTNIINLNTIKLSAINNDIVFQAHYSLQEQDKNEQSIYFLTRRFDENLQHEIYTATTPLNEKLKKCLTFYDGSDFDNPGEKKYMFFISQKSNLNNFIIEERKQDYYYKELITWQTDLSTGKVINQYIIPRKIFSFANRTRFKSIGEIMPIYYNNRFSFAVLEAGVNFKKNPNSFMFNRFKKETNLWRSNIVMYSLAENNELIKSLIYRNSGFDMVPIKYQSTNQNTVVFYMNSGRYEKFATLDLNQL